MPSQVIQGFFINPDRAGSPFGLRPVPAMSAPPSFMAGNRGGPALQRHACGHGAQGAHAHPGGLAAAARAGLQRPANPGHSAVDPAHIGLARSGGQPLPRVLLAKMEAAFAADFSKVRVHIGPQAQRIGALAFTTGNDLYFAPGQYQPDNLRGQQLIGHELAHVIQQRQGRVRGSGGGVTIVQDRALEAEADRLGMLAAGMRFVPGSPQPRVPGGAPAQHGQPIQPSMSWSVGLGAIGMYGGYTLAGGFGLAALGLGALGALAGRFMGGDDPAPVPVPVVGPIAPVLPVVPVAPVVNLDLLAKAINGLHSYNDIATLAVARRTDGTYAIYTQRGYTATRLCGEVLEAYGLPPVIDVIEAAEEAKHNMHAEMLAISEYFAGNQPKPTRIGASRNICELCRRVLTIQGVVMETALDPLPKNWCSPYYFNRRAEPHNVPRSRKNHVDY
jgi:hypothetical protein